MTPDEVTIRAEYQRLLKPGQQPYGFQIEVGQKILNGDNVLLHAPTGCGKTRAVLVPFLIGRRRGRWRRLIYALPLRALANSIYEEARKTLAGTGYEASIQTGEEPRDPFFSTGDVVVCTYDQLLSGLLGAPYGLGLNLANINGASIAGTLVVFDEFHLMEPGKAFLTAAALMHLFRGMCQSVWMTATATAPLEALLVDALGTATVRPTVEELNQVPAVSGVCRKLKIHDEPLTAAGILAAHKGQSIVVTNQVRWSQDLFEALRRPAGAPEGVLLHSLFFRRDRASAEANIREWFGPEGGRDGIAVATQTIEAGINATSDDIHIHECPMNAFVQRAGRNARFPNDDGSVVTGTVHLWPLPDQNRPWLPYDQKMVEATTRLLRRHDGAALHPSVLAEWVDEIHRESDAGEIARGWRSRLDECLEGIHTRVMLRKPASVAQLIREVDRVRVIVREQPPDAPWAWDSFSLRLDQIEKAVSAADGVSVWGRCAGPEDEPIWKPITEKKDVRGVFYMYCLSPSVAEYDSGIGLRLGTPGSEESPALPPDPRPGFSGLGCERWIDHSKQVTLCCGARAAEELGAESLLISGLASRYGLSAEEILGAVRASGLLHDLAKLQNAWQRWALTYQRRKDSASQSDRALAHTDYDGGVVDRALSDETSKQVGRRPPHAGPGALYCLPLLSRLCPVTRAETKVLGAAIAAAILGHHGGWLGRDDQGEMGGGPLWPGWAKEARELLALTGADPMIARTEQVANGTGKRECLAKLLKPVCGPDAIVDNWPLIAYLTRTLRLSDQKATAEGSDAP